MKKLICAVTVLAVSTAQAVIINVPAQQPTIQAGIIAANPGDEVVVAPGTYFEAINFVGKAITVRSTDPTDPAVVAATIINGGGSGTVVTCTSGEGSDTALSGLVITGGNAVDGGGGMLNAGSSPTVTNCSFIGNTGAGGGMYNTDNSSPTVTNCTFSGNTATGFGGGMLSEGSSSPTVINCTFSGNTAPGGGGMANTNSSPTVTNCAFTGNTAGNGGGMANDGASPTVTNCSFIENTASSNGGGMANLSSNPTVTNCTFSGNSAVRGGGMANLSSNPTVTNCILWGDSPEEIVASGTPIVTYSDVQGGWPGTGNIDADPLFVDPDNGDFRLSPGSPCIDAGNNWGLPQDTTDLDGDGDTRELTPWDLDGNPRFNADPADFDPGCGVPVVVDMGAYEFQFDPVDEVFLGDLDGDGIVGIVDFLALLANWGPCEPGCCLADLDIDGDVGITDFLLLLASWGR
ncbi:MAG: hypothetical protein IID28_09820 [Planctomycetes bacterium]|nr:hypothetical protein [Planctomycetota bacterium]